MKKVVLITGISSGFGKEISQQLAERGHIVYGSIRSECKIAENVKTVFIELSQPETIKSAVESLIQQEGRIDVLINNAGMHSGGPIEDATNQVIEAQLNINYFGWINMIKSVLPHMRKQRSGTIINISSIGGITGLPFQGIFSSVKFAIEGLSTALRYELREFNIKVVVVNPGDFKTRNTETRIVSMKKDSQYKAQFAKTLSIIERDETEGEDPKLLARLICRIVEKKNPRQRYIVGAFMQKFACVAKIILPEQLFDWLIANHYGIK